MMFLQGTPDVTASVLSVPEQPQVGLVNLVGQAVPPPPPITGNVDPTKIEEIRRTIYVGNLNTNVSIHSYAILHACIIWMHASIYYMDACKHICVNTRAV